MSLPRTLFACALAAGAGTAQAFSCAPTQSDECRLELSTLTIVFDAGIYNFDGDSQLNGSDGYVVGYTVGAGQFPDLDAVDSNGGTRVGFSFDPGMYGQVGGSGFSGDHEAFAYFTFNNLQFIPKPGYRLDGVEFTVAGSFSRVGNGYVALGVPGAVQFNGDQFTGSHLFDTFSLQQQYMAYFSANASYEEGEDGTAASYGTASAAFDFASLVAHVSAVPEPQVSALWLLGGLGVAGAVRMRGQRGGRRDEAAPAAAT